MVLSSNLISDRTCLTLTSSICFFGIRSNLFSDPSLHLSIYFFTHSDMYLRDPMSNVRYFQLSSPTIFLLMSSFYQWNPLITSPIDINIFTKALCHSWMLHVTWLDLTLNHLQPRLLLPTLRQSVYWLYFLRSRRSSITVLINNLALFLSSWVSTILVFFL